MILVVKNVRPVEKGIVTRSNKLIEARYKLSLYEQKIIYSIVSLIQPDDKEFNKFRFKVSELAKFCGINPKNAYHEIEEITRSLLTRVLTVKEDKRTIQTHWVQSAVYNLGMVEFELDINLRPYLLGLKQAFTSINIKELMSFKSQYSGRIYELLYQQYTFGSRNFSLGELRDLIGLEPKEYSMYADLRRFIIEPAIKDINKNTSMFVSYETEKENKKVAFIIFHMKMIIEKKECLNEGLKVFEELSKTEEELTKYINNPKTVKQLLKKHGEERCQKQLDNFKKQKNIKNPSGWLMTAIENDYDSISVENDTQKYNPNCEKCNGTGIVERYINDPRYEGEREFKYPCDCWKK